MGIFNRVFGKARLVCFALALAGVGGNVRSTTVYGLHEHPSAEAIKFAVEVPLLDCDGTPCVEARIGSGKVARWGIDTGNVDSVVDSKASSATGLKPLQSPKPGTPSGMFRT
jgi:hypothetical protein